MNQPHEKPGTEPDALQRYSRQTLYAPFGEAGQKRLRLSSAALIGCGALGSTIADMLVRAGIGALRVVDRDFVELGNLQRQTLFDEHDVAEGLPKAEAAVRKLRRANSSVELEAVVDDVHPANVQRLIGDVDVLLDGTDNFETRYLLNDAAVKLEIPWVYAACVGADGLTLPILPGRSPCLRCLWPEAPPPGTAPTCDTAGVLGPAATLIACLASMAALQILIGNLQPSDVQLCSARTWTRTFRSTRVGDARDPQCPCCVRRRFEYLDATRTGDAVILCGRNSVQLTPAHGAITLNLAAIAARLPPHALIRCNRHLLRFRVPPLDVTLFPDARAIVSGTDDVSAARSAYAKFVGT